MSQGGHNDDWTKDIGGGCGTSTVPDIGTPTASMLMRETVESMIISTDRSILDLELRRSVCLSISALAIRPIRPSFSSCLQPLQLLDDRHATNTLNLDVHHEAREHQCRRQTSAIHWLTNCRILGDMVSQQIQSHGGT
jgi:hypothetical protein